MPLSTDCEQSNSAQKRGPFAPRSPKSQTCYSARSQCPATIIRPHMKRRYARVPVARPGKKCRETQVANFRVVADSCKTLAFDSGFLGAAREDAHPASRFSA